MSGIHVVFGASGTVGTALLHDLHARGENVRAIVHSRPPTAPANEVARADLSSGDGLETALEQAKTVFLATGDMQDQVAAELRVVEAAQKKGVERVVKLSIMAADSEAFFYARVHREIERGLQASGLPFTHLRPGGFMQNFATYYGHEIRSSGTLTLPCADFPESFIDARDVAATAACCLVEGGQDGRALTLCGPRPTSYSEALEIIGSACGRPLRLRANDPNSFRASMLPWAVSEEHVHGIVDMLRFHAAARAPGSDATLRTVTRQEPRTLEAFVAEQAGHWMP